MELPGTTITPPSDSYSAKNGVSFYGTSKHKVSSRNQVAIPKTMLKSIQQADEGHLLLIRWQDDKFLRMHTQMQMDQKINEIQHKEELNQEIKDLLIEHLAASAVTIEPDKQGRFVLPSRWVEELALKEEIVFRGTHKRIEIWSVNALESKQAEDRDKIVNLSKELGHVF